MARRRPGLLPRHLAAVRAAEEISNAATQAAILGSETLTFEPGEVRAGEYHLDIGTAGSSGLVLQTVLVPLLSADGESQLIIEGGTHNEEAPPFDFLDLSFAPLLRRTGTDLITPLLALGTAVGVHLADQLLVPLAQARGGSFLTCHPSGHFTTNACVIDRFFDLRITS